MEQIGMNSKSYRLKSELDEGLTKYAEDNNLHPLSIIEDLVECFLTDKEYLSVNPLIEKKDTHIEKIKYTYYDETKKRYQIGKFVDGKKHLYGSITQGASITREVVNFLESVNWDTKYSTSNTGLKGAEQINFLLSEMEKVNELMGTK